jgi:hypothetical protein
MRRTTIAHGAAFTIYALDLSDEAGHEDCPAKQFLLGLDRDNPPAAKSMANLLRRHAEHGPIHDVTRSREIYDGPDGKLFEFKTRQGTRLVYFLEPNRATVLTHGFAKGAPLRPEIARARRLRELWRSGQV